MGSARRRSLEQRVFGEGPKRILSIDGGGARALASVGMLAEVERRLAKRSGRGDFRLCEYFDLIGGASTGAIIAAGLAMGKTCAECADLLRETAPDAPASGPGGIGHRYDPAKMEAALTRMLGDYELSSPALKTGLALFVKRVDTAEVWTVSNNPKSAFWDGAADASPPVKRLVVRKVVQASLGAPVSVEPVRVSLAQDGAGFANAEALCVDVALAGLVNPAVHVLRTATMKTYGFGWPTGEDRILMLSIGSGVWPAKTETGRGQGDAATRIARSLFAGAADHALAAVTTLQGLAHSPRPWRIDGEIGDMKEDRLSPFPLLTFQRIDVRLEKDALAVLGLPLEDAEIVPLRDPAAQDPAVLARLHEAGQRAGQYYFRNWPGQAPGNWDSAMLPPRFDPAFFSERPVGDPRNRLDALGRFFKGGSSE